MLILYAKDTLSRKKSKKNKHTHHCFLGWDEEHGLGRQGKGWVFPYRSLIIYIFFAFSIHYLYKTSHLITYN